MTTIAAYVTKPPKGGTLNAPSENKKKEKLLGSFSKNTGFSKPEL
jgi:hypothetical protein